MDRTVVFERADGVAPRGERPVAPHFRVPGPERRPHEDHGYPCPPRRADGFGRPLDDIARVALGDPALDVHDEECCVRLGHRLAIAVGLEPRMQCAALLAQHAADQPQVGPLGPVHATRSRRPAPRSPGS
jgi:hypothetical protein